MTDPAKGLFGGLAVRLRDGASWCARGRQRGVLLILFAFSPALFTAALIADHAVNIPVWDGWERGVLIEKARTGTLDLGYITSTHIDHRPVVPRLLTLASSALTGGDVRLEMWIGFVAVLAGALGLTLVLRQTLATPAWFWTTAFLVNLVLFSPLQYQNFLWAVQLAFLLPLGCLGLLVAVMASGWSLPWKVATAALLAELATLSFGHGLVLWPVAICLVLMDRAHTPRVRAMSASILAAFAALTVYGYFNWNYVNTSQPQHAYGTMPGEAPPAVDRFENIKERSERVTDYFWSSLGNPVVRLLHSDPAKASVGAGKVCLMLFAASVLWMLWRWRDDGHWRALLPWAAVGTFSVVVAALLASGRGANLPFERSLMSRYMSLTMYLVVAVLVFGSYWLSHRRADGRARALALVLASAFAALQSQQWVYGVHKMAAWESARLQERFQLLYLPHVEPRLPGLLDSTSATKFATAQALYLDGEGLMRPPFFDTLGFGDFARSEERALMRRSELLIAQMGSGAELFVRGFATLEDGRAGDGMLVSWRSAGGEWRFLDVIEIKSTSAMRASFYDGQFGGNPGNLSRLKNWARFERHLDISELSQDVEVEIGLWVADTKRMVVSPLKRTLRFTRDELEPGAVLWERN